MVFFKSGRPASLDCPMDFYITSHAMMAFPKDCVPGLSTVTDMLCLMNPRTCSLQHPICMQEATSPLTKSAGKPRPVHLLEEPSESCCSARRHVQCQGNLAAFGKLALLLAVLGLAWQRPNFFGTQYAMTPAVRVSF